MLEISYQTSNRDFQYWQKSDSKLHQIRSNKQDETDFDNPVLCLRLREYPLDIDQQHCKRVRHLHSNRGSVIWASVLREWRFECVNHFLSGVYFLDRWSDHAVTGSLDKAVNWENTKDTSEMHLQTSLCGHFSCSGIALHTELLVLGPYGTP